MSGQIEKIFSFVVLVGFGAFLIINIGNVDTALGSISKNTVGLIHGIARA